MIHDKNLVRQFFRVSDAMSLLNLAQLQYSADSSGLAYRVQHIMRICFKELSLSSPKEAMQDCQDGLLPKECE